MADGDKDQMSKMPAVQPGTQEAGMPDIVPAQDTKLNEASANDNLQTDGSAFD